MQIYYICQIYVDRFTSNQDKNDPIGTCILSNIFTSELFSIFVYLSVCLSVCLSYHMPFVHTELERRRKFTFYEKLLLTLRNNGVILSSIAQRSKSREQKCRNSFFSLISVKSGSIYIKPTSKWSLVDSTYISASETGIFAIFVCFKNRSLRITKKIERTFAVSWQIIK